MKSTSIFLLSLILGFSSCSSNPKKPTDNVVDDEKTADEKNDKSEDTLDSAPDPSKQIVDSDSLLIEKLNPRFKKLLMGSEMTRTYFTDFQKEYPTLKVALSQPNLDVENAMKLMSSNNPKISETPVFPDVELVYNPIINLNDSPSLFIALVIDTISGATTIPSNVDIRDLNNQLLTSLNQSQLPWDCILPNGSALAAGSYKSYWQVDFTPPHVNAEGQSVDQFEFQVNFDIVE